MKSLPGTWTLVRKDADASRPPFIVAYRLVSNGSAIVESWGQGGAHETATVFHRDHNDVMLTHDCAQGNQPRLRAASATSDTVDFAFADVTNRASDQDMLVRRTLHVEPRELTITEVYRSAAGADETTVYRFTAAP